MLTKPSSLLHSFHIQRSSFSVDNFRLSAKIFFIGTWWNHALSPLFSKGIRIRKWYIFFIFLFLYAKVFYNPYEPKLRLDECTSCTAIGKADVAQDVGAVGKGKQATQAARSGKGWLSTRISPSFFPDLNFCNWTMTFVSAGGECTTVSCNLGEYFATSTPGKAQPVIFAPSVLSDQARRRNPAKSARCCAVLIDVLMGILATLFIEP